MLDILRCPFGFGARWRSNNPGANGNPALADFSCVSPDLSNKSRFFAHHMTVYDDGGGNGSVSLQWESWLAQWTFGDCSPGAALADFDQDMDVDLNDLLVFEEYAKQKNPAADIDGNGLFDGADLAAVIAATGQSP